MKNYAFFQITTAAILLVFICCGSVAADETQEDLMNLQGVWILTSYSMLGRSVGADVIEGKKWIFDGEELTWQDGSVKQLISITLDPTKSPKWIDLAIFTGTETSPVIKAVYELKGDVLKVCSGGSGKDARRPDSVDSTLGTQTESFVLKRED